MKSRYYLLDFIGTILVAAGLAKLWANDGLLPDFIPLEYDGFSLLLVALCFYIPSTVILFKKGIIADRKRREKLENQGIDDE